MVGFNLPGEIRTMALSVLAVWILSGVSVSAQSANYLLAISHRNDVNKKITVYKPDGEQVFNYIPSGNYDENIPTWILSAPASKRLLVSCTVDEDHHHEKDTKTTTEGLVEVFDYSGYPDSGITHVDSVEVGNVPFHNYLAPDGRVVVSNDEDGTLSFIEPASLEVETVTGGYHHGTVVFVGDASGYDTYVGRFLGETETGGIDIIGKDGAVRTTLTLSLPNPHSGVYSPLTKRVYFACMGGLEVIGTEGTDKDKLLEPVPLPGEGVEAQLKISPDGRHVIGNIYYEDPGDEQGAFYSYDTMTGALTSVESVNCTDFGYSPDGKWLVAGDLVLTGTSTVHQVHVINTDPSSSNFMKVVKAIPLDEPIPSRVGFSGVQFSPDGTKAYVALTERDQLLVINMEDFSETTLPVEAAPWFLLAFSTAETPSGIEAWQLYE